MSSSIVEITKRWRADDELRRVECFADSRDAAACVRRIVDEVLDGTLRKKSLREVHGLCKAIELDFFRFIGKTITTNETPEDSATGPKPISGMLVAILSRGQGLVLTSTLDKLKSVPGSSKKIPIRYGFLVSPQKLAEIERQERKDREKAKKKKKKKKKGRKRKTK